MTKCYGEIVLEKKLGIKYSLFGFLALLLLGVDQFSKMKIAEAANGVEGKSFAVIENVINFTYVKNTGASMGILQGQRIALIVVTVALLGAGVWYFKKHRPESVLLLSACSLIASGAVGNLIDRVKLGYVRDFIDVQFVNFYTFNIADCGIVVGAALLIIYAFINIED